MRNQHPGAPQPQLRQPSGVNDLQLWQQQILFKQFQDFQKQQQLQLDQGARHLNPLNQLIAKQVSTEQLSVIGNGIASNRDSNFAWQGEVVGNEPKVANAAQMYIGVGEANWAQYRGNGLPLTQNYPNGLMIAHDQSQALRAAGCVPQQQMDQSLYGAPIAVARGSVLGQYNQSHGNTSVGSEMFNRVGGIIGDRPTKPSAFNTFQNDQTTVSSTVFGQEGFFTSKPNFQEKNLLSQIPLESFTDTVSENVQQEGFSSDSLTAGLHGRHDQQHIGWAGSVEGKSSTQVGSSQETVGLDPTEAKILFGSDDGFWDGSFARTSGGLHGTQFGCADYVNTMPSIQCGSWSALMQSAVAETSSGDTGLQDEWSGLNFHKETPAGNNISVMENSLQQSPLLSSRSSPLSFESKANPSYIQQTSTKFPFAHDGKLRTDALQENKWVDQGLPQKSAATFEVGSALQVHNAPDGNWIGHTNDRLNTGVQSNGMGQTMQNELRPWPHQQPSYNTDPNKLNGGWNVSETYPTSVDSQSVNNRAMHADRGASNNMWKSNQNNLKASYASTIGGLDQAKLGTDGSHLQAHSSFINMCASTSSSAGQNAGHDVKQLVDNRPDDYNRHVLVNPSESYGAQENFSRYQQQMSRSPQESMNNSDQASGETCERKKDMSSDSYISGRSQSGQHAVANNSQRDNSWLNATDNVATNNKKLSSQVVRKTAAKKFQYHPMGNISTETHTAHRPISQPELLGSIQDQGMVWTKVRTSSPITVTDKEKENAYCKGTEEVASRSNQPGGQHMLELLQKVDQSRENSNSGHFVSSDQNQLGVPAPFSSDCPPSHHNIVPQSVGVNLASSQQAFLATSQNFGSFSTLQNDVGVGKPGPPVLSSQEANFTRDKPQWDPCSRAGNNIPQSVPEASYSQPRLNSDHHWPLTKTPQHAESGSGQLVKGMPDFNQQGKLASLSGQYVRIQDIGTQGSSHGLGRVQGLNLPPHSLSTKSLYMRGADQLEASHSTPEGAFSKMFHNVRTDGVSQQQGKIANQMPSNAVHPIPMTGRNLETTHWPSSNLGNQNMTEGGNGPCEIDSCTVKSQPLGYYEDQRRSNYSSIPVERSEFSSLPAVGIQQASQPQMMDRSHQEPSQNENASVVITNGTEAGGQFVRPSNLMHQNHSLLHQVQAMKDSDDSCRNMKRLKGIESNFEGQNMVSSTNEPFVYGFPKGPSGSENASAGKMLCFSSDGKEDTNVNHLSQPQLEDFSNQNSSLNVSSSASGSGAEHVTHINPQMAPSWFEQYGSYKNGQVLPVYDGLDSSRRLANSAGAQFFFCKPADKMQVTASLTTADQGNTQSFVSAGVDQLTTLQSSSPLVMDHSIAIIRPEKRKIDIIEALPWHKEITQDFHRLQTVSEAELEWSHASNRRIDKLEDELDMLEGRISISRSKRRITLTTQLMQQLLRALPASIFSADAFTEYGAVVFRSARLALGDACSLVSGRGSSRKDHSTSGNTIDENQEANGGNAFYSKVVEDFMGRAKKLESVLLRLEKGYSPADMRVECQDLEKFSMINRFAKFHGRGNAEMVDGSSSSDAMVRRPIPQRYVTAFPMPRSLPEGVPCLSL